MADTYIITAKTVEEAIAIAKRQYEDASHEVSCDILEMPKKGIFFGIGAKEAKIKVTVSKISSVESELGSLVADIKNMKAVTDRGSDGEKPESGKKQQNDRNQQKQGQQNQQKQNQQGQQKQGQQKQGQQGQNQQKQNQQKQGQQNQNQQKQSQQNQNQQKQGQQNQQKQGQQKQNQQNQNQQKNEQKPAAAPVEQAAAPAAAAEAPSQTQSFGNADAAYKSSLGNQAKPSRRARQKKGASHADESSAVTVSSPVGLSDFVSETSAEGFGSGEQANAGGRMNNDIRRKNRQQKQAEKPAAEKPEASVPAPLKSRPPRNRSDRSGPLQRSATEAMSSKYDVAETDEDYAKLDRLVAEAEGYTPAFPGTDAGDAAAQRENRRREPITEEEMKYALEFANMILRDMNLDASAVPAECPEGEDFEVTETATVYPKINIIGEDTGILIGHHGETLDSIQYLVNLSALRKTKSKDGDYVKIVVDIENYRQKREDTLRALARRMAARAVKYRRNVFLEPMNAYERRIIHSELQSFENVSTHSVGADRDRKIIITYEGPDKAPDNRRRRKGEDAPEAEVQQKSEQPKKRSRSRNRNRNRSEQPKTGEFGVESVLTETASAAESGIEKEVRRPKKQQRIPIEMLGEWLPDAGEADENGLEEDTLKVLSSVRAAADALENDTDEESFEAKADALEEALEALGKSTDEE